MAEQQQHDWRGEPDAEALRVWMRWCLRLARRAAALGEVPVGAAVLGEDGRLLGQGFNAPIGQTDPSHHAEIAALRQAARATGNYRLPGATLVCTLEPCAMCVGALVQARVARLVYAADEPKTGAVVSQARLLDQPWHNHRVRHCGGLLAESSALLLREFFRARR